MLQLWRLDLISGLPNMLGCFVSLRFPVCSSGATRATAGEYAGNIFWIVGFSLITSWIVAVVFTPNTLSKTSPLVSFSN